MEGDFGAAVCSIPLDLFKNLYHELDIGSESLVLALHHGRYDLANEMHRQGLRVSFAKEMLRSASSTQARWLVAKQYELGTEGFIWAMGRGTYDDIVNTWIACSSKLDAMDYRRAVESSMRHHNPTGIMFMLSKPDAMPLIAMIIQVIRADYLEGLKEIDRRHPLQRDGRALITARRFRAKKCIAWLTSK